MILLTQNISLYVKFILVRVIYICLDVTLKKMFKHKRMILDLAQMTFG